jgi:photosystem II stability/assembly factor-like uncharacterized protein
MRLRSAPFALLFASLALLACSGSGSGGDQPGTDSGGDDTLTPGGDTAPADAAPDGPTDDQILGASWVKLSAAPSISGKQDDLYFVDPSIGFSVNGLGRIYGTTDGGQTFTKLLDQPGTYFRAVSFLDATHGFAANIGTDYYPGVTDTQPLYETNDSGATWTKVTTISGPMPNGICGFWKIDDSNLVAVGRVGGPSFFLKSSDAGATWTSTNVSSQLPMLVDAHFNDANDGVLTGGSSTGAGSQCRILHTTDGGATWTKVFQSKNAGTMCWKVSFPSAMVGYAAVLTFSATTPSSFIKTTDGGNTWTEMPFVDGGYAGLGVGFITENIGWIGGEASSKPAYRTSDGGNTWTPDPSLGPYVNRIRFVGPRTGYAIGSTIYKLEIP